MGEAKRRREGSTTAKDLVITKREQWWAALLMVNRENDKVDRRHVRVALEEMGATQLAEDLLEGQAPPTGPASLEPLCVSLSDASVEMLLKAMDKPLGGAQGYILGAMETKLISLRDGTYRLPDAFVEAAAPDAVEAASP